jgi:hypothetical protein
MVRDKQLSCNREGEYSIFDAEKDAMIGTISARHVQEYILLKGLDCRISVILCFGAGRS